MLVIPLPGNRKELEILRDEHDLFDLFMNDSMQQSYIIVQDNTITWLGQGTVPNKLAYQIRTRTIELGKKVENPICVGNVGLGGDFSGIEDAFVKKYPVYGFCIDEMNFSGYRGQKIRGNKEHYSIIEPILCILSSEPSVRLKQFLQTLGWGGRKKVECSGEWGYNLRLMIDDKVCLSIEDWLMQFYKMALPHKNTEEIVQNEQQQLISNIFSKDGMLSVIGIIFIILILKSCFGG